MANSQEETKAWIEKLYKSLDVNHSSQLSQFFTEDAVMTAFNGQKLTHWTGLSTIKAHMEELTDIFESHTFDVLRVDLVGDGSVFYNAINIISKMKSAPEPITIKALAYCVRVKDGGKDEGKAKELTFYEDPTVFVEMAKAGKLPEAK